MPDQPPPELGALLQVVPVVQSQRREPWTVTLASVERWDNCFVAVFDILGTVRIDRKGWSHPWLDIDASDDRGTRYEAWFGGGYGGGLRGGGQYHRLICKFTPPLDAAVESLQLTARLQLQRPEPGFPPRHIVAWEDPEPWVFPIALIDAPPANDDEGHPSATPHATTSTLWDDTLPEWRRLQWVTPVIQTREDAGLAITCIAVEQYDDGFRVVYRLRGTAKNPASPEPAVRVYDDRGNVYRTWGGGGTGEPSFGGCHWRLSTDCAPALDPAARTLHVEITAIPSVTFDLTAGEPGQGQLVPGETAAGDWSFVIQLR